MRSCAMKYLAVAILCLLCVAGCRKRDDELKVEVKNGTSETVEDIGIVLMAGKERTSRTISSLAPGESVTISFPRTKGDGGFSISGTQKGKAPYSELVGYVDNMTGSKGVILFCPKGTPQGFYADFQEVEDESTGGG